MDENRLRIEYERLTRLAAASGGIVVVAASPNLRHYDITLHVAAPVGTDEHYTVERTHTLSLDLTDDFPARAPLPRFLRPILAPNIWLNGVPCIVQKVWLPSQHLDQLVCDIIEEMQGLNPNYDSIANSIAGSLYLQQGFFAELRRRLGPPVHLVPPAHTQAHTISTVSTGAAQGRGSIQTVTAARPRQSSITTVPH